MGTKHQPVILSEWVIPLLFLIHNHPARLGWEPLMLWWWGLELQHPCSHHRSTKKHRGSNEWRDSGARLTSVTMAVLQHSVKITHLFLIPSPLLPDWCWVLSDTTSAPSCILSQPFAVCQLSCAAFWEQSKSSQAAPPSWLIIPKAAFKEPAPPREPQASQGLCKHLFFIAVGALPTVRCPSPWVCRESLLQSRIW